MYIMNIIIAGRDKGTMLMKVPAGNISYTQIVNWEEFNKQRCGQENKKGYFIDKG